MKHGCAVWVLGRLTVQDRFSALPRALLCENLVLGWQVVVVSYNPGQNCWDTLQLSG